MFNEISFADSRPHYKGDAEAIKNFAQSTRSVIAERKIHHVEIENERRHDDTLSHTPPIA